MIIYNFMDFVDCFHENMPNDNKSYKGKEQTNVFSSFEIGKL